MALSPELDARSSTSLHYRSLFEAAGDGLIVCDLEGGGVIDANSAASAMHGLDRNELIGLHPEAFIHADSVPLYTAYVKAVQRDGTGEVLLVDLRRDGSLFYVEMHGSALTLHDRPCLLSVVRDVSKRVQAERLLQRRVEVRTREQAMLLEISQTLASVPKLRPALILDQMRGIVEYTRAGIFALEDSDLVTLAVRGPLPLEQAGPFRIRLDSPEKLTGLFDGHRPKRIADVWGASPAAQLLRSLLLDQAAPLLEGVQSWMWVPLAVNGRVIGGVGVAHARRHAFTAHHADLALTVANQAAIAMVNTELVEQAQTIAVVHERQRLAQELHDAVNQSLFSAGLIAEVLPRLWEQNPDEGRRSLGELRRLTHGALAEMRMLLAELRPAALTDTELGDLLRLLGSALAGRTNIPVAVTVTGEGILPGPTQVAFYRVCQEALNNIARHAEASRVAIDLFYADAAAELRIRDDGCGFDTAHTPAGHYGLSMMHERAAASGAVLSITSQPGQGTELVMRWADTGEALVP